MPNTPHPYSKLRVLQGLTGAALAAGSFGCAVNVNLNANRFDSPETRGEVLRGSVDAALVGSNTLVPIPDAAANPIEIGAPGWDRSQSSARMVLNLGLLERLDIGLKAPWNGPLLFTAKYQFLGEPELKAQSGNFSVAVTSAGGITQPSGTFTNGAITGKEDYSLSSFDFALIVGKRFAETFMVYGGPFFSTFSYSGKVTQSGAINAAFPFDGSATQTGANLGLQLDSVLGAIKIEEAWALANVSGTHQAGFYTGACLSYRF